VFAAYLLSGVRARARTGQSQAAARGRAATQGQAATPGRAATHSHATG